ncbi:GNAT family N-acetyltransferase [Curtobacterium sp. MCLR17_036]|uniref:GNAT family N-acetyltransferase n=1 Tax=Curtobacterium sp. MCLR17_036 TaxID=2175620 RepID=UPI0024DF945F|nr:GNAT family N-acetyltransferase [Curtobacterium sp. MCLR17_036]WIE66265.1 GNAT family N-acetyltransferase [Curtobacterium sp. MCLR17_036]
MSHEFRNETDRQRWAMYVDGALVSVLDHRENGDAIAFPHTYTVPAHRGHGYAAALVEHAVAEVETTTTKRIVPMCWFVGEWFDAHPEKAHLLVRGIAD